MQWAQLTIELPILFSGSDIVTNMAISHYRIFCEPVTLVYCYLFHGRVFHNLMQIIFIMASIIPGFEYDIFISYRQKDNKYDGWVTEFVDNLKRELDATFKEEISLYFDINPHDGLLETHDVGDSLKEKLRCLIFIPILSRTYCDPKSFAWEHEFSAFIEQASADRFGLKVKLQYGNIASRVLPVIIHDLDDTDINLCESMLGTVLRGVEFVYKSSGVNRPLRAKEDKPGENLNNTIYRDQINKIALAVREVITGIQSKIESPVKEEVASSGDSSAVVKGIKKIRRKRSVLMPERLSPLRLIIVAALIVAAIIFYPKVFAKNKNEFFGAGGRNISVAVMPFENNTNDTLWDIWKLGIQDILVSSLSGSADLRVIQSQTVNSLVQSRGITNYASISPDFSNLMSKDLGANICIIGSIKQAGDTCRLDASVFDPRKETIFKSHSVTGRSDNILFSIDSLSRLIQNTILIANMIQSDPLNSSSYQPTGSSEAYRYYLMGENARAKRDYNKARSYFAESIRLDSGFSRPILLMSVACKNQGLYDEGREWAMKAYALREKMPIWDRLLTEKNYAFFFETSAEEIVYFESMLQIDDKYPGTYYDLGLLYSNLEQYDKAIPLFEKSLELYDKYDTKPWWIFNYSLLGWAYLKTGEYRKIDKLYRKAEIDFPDDPLIYHMRAILALIEGDTIAVKEQIDKYSLIRRERGWSEAGIVYNLGEIYKESGLITGRTDYMDIAEKYHRQEIWFEPDNKWRIFDLAWFLIETERGVDEGLELIEKAIEMNGGPNYYILNGKGLGLYFKGEYNEALQILEEARELSPYYYYPINKNISIVKKAIAEQINS